jgi:hypothetical protein
MNTKILSTSVFLFLTVIAPIAAQVPYFCGSGWKPFSFSSPPPYDNNEGRFAFTVYPGQKAVLTVTDSAWNNEIFEIFNNGSYTGWRTSAPTFDGRYWTSICDILPSPTRPHLNSRSAAWKLRPPPPRTNTNLQPKLS